MGEAGDDAVAHGEIAGVDLRAGSIFGVETAMLEYLDGQLAVLGGVDFVERGGQYGVCLDAVVQAGAVSEGVYSEGETGDDGNIPARPSTSSRVMRFP